MKRIEILDGATVVNVIIASEEEAERQYPGAWRLVVEQPAPEAGPLPAVVITGITVDEASAARAVIAPDFSAMKLPVGAVVTIDVELQVQGQRVPGFGEEFAMPMLSTDRMMRHIDIKFTDGRAQFTAVMNDSKRWEVTPELINSGLPREAHMDFAGITITAVE